MNNGNAVLLISFKLCENRFRTDMTRLKLPKLHTTFRSPTAPLLTQFAVFVTLM